MSSFTNCRLEQSTGILFRYRQCNICNRFLDDEIRQKKKRQEILSASQRRGTMIIQQGFCEGSDDEYDMPFLDDCSEKMRLYDCGHPFHVKCIQKYLNE